MRKFILKAANSVLSFILSLFLLLSGGYAGYALWDNNRIYSAAEDVQTEMMKIKPVLSEDPEEEKDSFVDLYRINPDVCGWITLEGTEIDYPVLQGEDNMVYVNMDVYGDFGLAGSIFLDARNDRSFGDIYSILYGHHMDKHQMFGDLDLYKDKAFFDEHKKGTLILPESVYELEIFACLLVKSNDSNIFYPAFWQDADINGLYDFAEQEALHIRTDTVRQLRETESPKILAMTTCASEFTDARTIILAVMKPYHAAYQEE